MERQNNSKVRKVTSRGTPSYQLGHYEMKGDKGKRRSVFKVDVHLGEYESPEIALAEWSQEIQRLRKVGRENQVKKLETKLNRLRELTGGNAR